MKQISEIFISLENIIMISKQITNAIQLALNTWDDTTSMMGEVFNIYV
jgi:hypothetical protein